MPLRVLVVDDTIVYRKIVSDALVALPDVEVVGTANNGKIALSRIKILKPDLITLDIEMPELNGLEVLDALKREAVDVGAIMLSSLTVRGGDLTMKALELGAFDFITKPEGGSMEENRENIKRSLAPLLRAFARNKEIKAILKSKASHAPAVGLIKKADGDSTYEGRKTGIIERRLKSEVVGIGISTGGPNALAQMLPRLPGNINVPVLIVQHMPPLFTQSLANNLDAKCKIRVKEAEHGEVLVPNVAYIAPGGKQMKVTLAADATRKIVSITDDPPENFCKPSVDYLFRSVAHHFLGRSTGVIMTGMGNDGTLGLRLMKRNGARVIAQDEATSVVFGMPHEAIKAGVVDVVASLDKIADEIVRTIR